MESWNSLTPLSQKSFYGGIKVLKTNFVKFKKYDFIPFKVHLCQEQHREKLEGEISCSPAHDFIQLKTKVKRGFINH